MLQCAASRRRCPLALVRDGFPQQRSWSDRIPWKLKLALQPNDFRAVIFRFPLKPPTVAAGASSRAMKIETLSVDFTDDQKRSPEGCATGLKISKAGRGLAAGAAEGATEPVGPDAAHLKAQDKVIASGKK